VAEKTKRVVEKTEIPNGGKTPSIGKCWANVIRAMILFEEKRTPSSSHSTIRSNGFGTPKLVGPNGPRQ